MTHSVDIQQLTEEMLSEKFLETLGHLASMGELDVEGAKNIFRAQSAMGMRTYVAIVDGHIVGSATMIVEPKFIHAGGLVAHIEDVVVHGGSQGKGIGKKLVEHATAEAKKAGCYKAILACTPANKPFYEKCGYREHEIEMRCDL